jgi:hypothetical protein
LFISVQVRKGFAELSQRHLLIKTGVPWCDKKSVVSFFSSAGHFNFQITKLDFCSIDSELGVCQQPKQAKNDHGGFSFEHFKRVVRLVQCALFPPVCQACVRDTIYLFFQEKGKCVRERRRAERILYNDDKGCCAAVDAAADSRITTIAVATAKLLLQWIYYYDDDDDLILGRNIILAIDINIAVLVKEEEKEDY